MENSLFKNAVIVFALTLILLTGYTLGTLTAPSRAEKEQNTVEPTTQEKTATQTTQEAQTPPQDEVTNDTAVVQRLDRIASILEDKLSKINDNISKLGEEAENLNVKLNLASSNIENMSSTLENIYEYWMEVKFEKEMNRLLR